MLKNKTNFDNTSLETNQKPKSQTYVKGSNLRYWGWSITKYLIIFIVIYTVINWWRQPIMPTNPTLQLVDYKGERIDIAKLSHETPVLVYFWGTWCGVCKITSPTINSLSQSSDYPIVTIAIQSGSNHELEGYLKKHDYSFTTINDDNGDIFNEWHGQVTPTFVLLNNGEMTQGLVGIQPQWSLRLRLWLSSL